MSINIIDRLSGHHIENLHKSLLLFDCWLSLYTKRKKYFLDKNVRDSFSSAELLDLAHLVLAQTLSLIFLIQPT